jgi:HNH endonuclease
MTDLRPWPTDHRYQVSAEGYVIGPSGRRVGTLRRGYRIVTISTADGRTSTTVHAMVCETFHGPRPVGMQACHDNGDTSDCRAGNLRWDVPTGNASDRVRHGTNGVKLSNEDVRAIRSQPKASRAALATRYGVTPGMISHIRTGHSWSNLT